MAWGPFSGTSFPKDYFYEVSAGRVPGSDAGFLVGLNEHIISTEYNTISDQGGVYHYMTSNTQLAISSSSSLDTGIPVNLVGLDEEYNPVAITATTDGTDGQAQSNFTSDQVFRINTVSVVGSKSPVGQLYISEVTTTVNGKPTDLTKIKAQIALVTNTLGSVVTTAGDVLSTNITHLGLVTVPAGRRMLILSIVTGCNKNGNAKIQGRVRPPGGLFQFISRNPSQVYQASQSVTFNPPLILPEKWDVDFIAISGSDDTSVQVQIFFILEDIAR